MVTLYQEMELFDIVFLNNIHPCHMLDVRLFECFLLCLLIMLLQSLYIISDLCFGFWKYRLNDVRLYKFIGKGNLFARYILLLSHITATIFNITIIIASLCIWLYDARWLLYSAKPHEKQMLEVIFNSLATKKFDWNRPNIFNAKNKITIWTTISFVLCFKLLFQTKSI